MAQTNEEPSMDAAVEPTKLKPVRLDLTPELHRMLRLVSAHEGRSMAAYARDLLAAHLPEELKRRGLSK